MCQFLGNYMVNYNENEDEIKYRSRRYDLIRSRSRDGDKYSKYKKWLSKFVKCCICEIILKWNFCYSSLLCSALLS